MNCFDCTTPTPAVAVCSQCGAGTCRDHAIVTAPHLQRTELINRQQLVNPPARLIRCQTCTAAVQARDHR